MGLTGTAQKIIEVDNSPPNILSQKFHISKQIAGFQREINSIKPGGETISEISVEVTEDKVLTEVKADFTAIGGYENTIKSNSIYETGMIGISFGGNSRNNYVTKNKILIRQI